MQPYTITQTTPDDGHARKRGAVIHGNNAMLFTLERNGHRRTFLKLRTDAQAEAFEAAFKWVQYGMEYIKQGEIHAN